MQYKLRQRKNILGDYELDELEAVIPSILIPLIGTYIIISR